MHWPSYICKVHDVLRGHALQTGIPISAEAELVLGA